MPRMRNGDTEAVMQFSPIKLYLDHNLLMDEINRRQILDHVEEIEKESDDDAYDDELDDDSDDDKEGEESKDVEFDCCV